MRLLMLLLLALPMPLSSQTAEPDPAPEEVVTGEQVGPLPPEIVSVTVGGGAAEAIQPAAPVSESSPSAGVAQPTMRNFLYQVLLAAVTALITALIWKAVF